MKTWVKPVEISQLPFLDYVFMEIKYIIADLGPMFWVTERLYMYDTQTHWLVNKKSEGWVPNFSPYSIEWS